MTVRRGALTLTMGTDLTQEGKLGRRLPISMSCLQKTQDKAGPMTHLHFRP